MSSILNFAKKNWRFPRHQKIIRHCCLNLGLIKSACLFLPRTDIISMYVGLVETIIGLHLSVNIDSCIE